jgi:outer membrane protein OmpA-like peptidoglycan-associated protein
MAALFLLPQGAEAQKAKDVKGSRDHPAVGARYPGSTIVRYITKEFDEYALLLGKVRQRNKPGKHEALEGKLTRASYEIAKGRTTLEVFRNYETALTEKGFKPLFTCKNKDCGGRAFNHTVVPYWGGFSENYGDQRYLAAKKDGPDGTVYAALYVVLNLSEGGPRNKRVYAQLDIVEIKAMREKMEVVDAAKMQKALDAAGHIALYGILFDHDSAKLRPESKATLAEVAKLLKARPKLKLFVVGHTDNQGTLDYNRKLSGKRAASVVRYLTKTSGIAKPRLEPHGLGFLAPVATNRTEAGKQKNRRVELVER